MRYNLHEKCPDAPYMYYEKDVSKHEKRAYEKPEVPEQPDQFEQTQKICEHDHIQAAEL